MRSMKKLTKVLALALTLCMVFTACQVPEGVEIPSGVSIPSDISDLSSEELAQLESYLDEAESSADAQDSEDAVASEGASDAEDAVAEGEAAANGEADAKKDAVQGTVKLASGRDWVHKILNVQEYMNAYPDLQAAYGDNWDGYVDHYLTYGLYEGRDEGKLFDPWEYAEAYPDVKAAYGDDANAIIQHYVNHGINEGKTAGTSAGYVDMADKVSREYMMSHDVVAREPSSRMEALTGHMDTVLKYARNIEGVAVPQLFVDGLNVDTYEPTRWNRGAANETYASNLYAQFNLLKAMDGMTMLTGDPKYSEAALEQITLRFNDPRMVDSAGLPYAGGHAYFDVKEGKQAGLDYHETKDYQLPLELMYKADPEGTKRYITAYWNSHILDWSCLIMNRHGDWNKDPGLNWDSAYTNPDPWVAADTCPFMSTGNDLMETAWFMTKITGDPKYEAWGERLLDKYIGVAHPETLLVGEQYGVMVEESLYGVDRLLGSTIGADFVTRTGFDFKTATLDDYKKFGANSLITRTSLKCNTAYGPQNMVEMYRDSGNEKLYTFVMNNMLNWARYVYDPVRHVYKTPILNDGTDLNEGGDGKKLIATKTGYYMAEGKPFPESESIWGGVLPALIDTISVLKPEDEAAYEEIWEAARAFARNVDLGDIGTRLGENVNLNMTTTQTSADYVMAVLKMYKYTGHPDYLELACHMGDRIASRAYDPELGMFLTSLSAPYAQISPDALYCVFAVEAASRGLIDQINLDLSHGGHEVPHTGKGEVTGNDIWWGVGKKSVNSVKFDREEYSIIVHDEPVAIFDDINGAEEISAIKQMASIGVMQAEDDGLFHPEKSVARAEIVEMVNALFGFTDAAQTAEAFADVDLDAAYAHYEVTRTEMASVIARALAVKVPDKTWHAGDATYRLTDADSIPAWAKEYADIVTNYRLMVDLEEDTFDPNAVVTKDMAAGIFQEVARYIELPAVKAILPEILPIDADAPMMKWESVDPAIVEVDSLGRLYPISTGTTTIRVESDGKYAYLEVTVAVQDDWMVKEVFIDGEAYGDFNSDITEYAINLDRGVYTVPTITATSYTGEEVIVEAPTELPGRVTFYVSGAEVKYHMDIDNTFIDYIVDQDFNHAIGTKIESIATDRYNWFVNGVTVAYRDAWKVIPKNWVRPDYEGYGCMVFPYKHIKNVDGQIYLKLAKEDHQVVGENADDYLLVFEMDLAYKNMKGKGNGFPINISEATGATYHSAARFVIDEKGISRKVDSVTVNRATRRKPAEGEFFKIQVVIDKKNQKFHYYYNGELLEKDVAFFHPGRVPAIADLYIGTPREDEDSQAELFMDNLKIYNITHNAYEEMFSQEPVPTNSPKPVPTWDPAIPTPTPAPPFVDETFDDYALSTEAASLGGEYWTGEGGRNGSENIAAVMAKGDGTDKWLEFTPLISADVGVDANTWYMRIDSEKQYELGEDADTFMDGNYLIVEMDVALTGEDLFSDAVQIRFGGSKDNSLADFNLFADHIGRSWGSAASERGGLTADGKNAYTQGEVGHLQWVLNRTTKSFSWMWNGVLFEKDYLHDHYVGMTTGTPALKYIKVSVPKQMLEAGKESIDTKFAIDNIKVYVSRENPLDSYVPVPIPTATPKPIPTWDPAQPTPTPAAPIIDESFDNFDVATQAENLSGDAWIGKWGTNVSGSIASIVAKDTGTDKLLKFIPKTATSGSYTSTPWYMNINADKQYAVGEGADLAHGNYLVVEMDVALTGQDPFQDAVKIRMGGDGNAALGEFNLFADHIGRSWGSASGERGGKTADGKNAYTQGEVGHLKWILNRTTRGFSWIWNGVLFEQDYLHSYYLDQSRNTPALKYIMVSVPNQILGTGAESTDVAFTIDNVKVYATRTNPLTESEPVPTPAPTAAPTPAPTASPAPTTAPIATPVPTAAPTAAPTEAPSVEPTPEAGRTSYVIDETFDGFEPSTQAMSVTGDFWKGTWGISYHTDKAVVVAKDSGTDQWLEFTPVTSLDNNQHELVWYMSINEEKQYTIGSGADVTDGNFLIVEMDVALTGEDAFNGGVTLRMGGDGNYALTEYNLFADRIGREWGYGEGEKGGLRGDGKNAYTQGEVGHLKWIYNRTTMQYSWFWNGVLVEQDSSFHNTSSIPALKYLMVSVPVQTLAEGVQSTDAKFVIDNVKLYLSVDDPMVTPTN